MDITWDEVPVERVRAGMRIGPLASWSLDVYEVTPHGWVCLNLETKRPTLFSPTHPTIHVLHRDGVPSVAHDGRHDDAPVG